jgi:3alpha(or 20beta)-hydroxysteroid dehydrogenase
MLTNNGGVGAYRGIHEIESNHMRRVTEINFMGSFFGIRAVVPSMREAGGGSIVNISSGFATTITQGDLRCDTNGPWILRRNLRRSTG